MSHFSPAQQNAIEALARDLDSIFGARLESLVVYPGNQGDGSVHSCALVNGLSFRDLVSCLPMTDRWDRRRVAVPLMLSTEELARTIDIFPLEYAAIIAAYTVVRGRDPFKGLNIPVEDIRRATEAQAKSHLIHLREAYLESHGETTRVARLIAASAAPLRALLTNIARLAELPANAGATPHLSDESLARMAESRMAVPAALVSEVLASSAGGYSTIADPSHLLAAYIDAARRIWEYVDRWH
jgi:hypothetical protein